MTFNQAKNEAKRFGLKVPSYDATSIVAQCWIDRIEMLKMAAEHGRLNEAIAEANKYAGWSAVYEAY